MNDHYISNTLSALVMLGAVALTYTTYSSYKEEVAITNTEQSTVAMEQAANAFLSFKADRVAQVSEVATSTGKATTSKVKSE